MLEWMLNDGCWIFLILDYLLKQIFAALNNEEMSLNYRDEISGDGTFILLQCYLLVCIIIFN